MTAPQRGFLFMALGFAGWMAALSVLYGVQAAGCAWSWQHIRFGPFSLLRAVLVGLFVASLGLQLWLLVCSRRRLAASQGSNRDEFLWRASVCLTIAAIVATIWIGMALPLPSVCR